MIRIDYNRLRFLITAPSQIHFGWDPTWGNKITFPRKMVVFQQQLSLGTQTEPRTQ